MKYNLLVENKEDIISINEIFYSIQGESRFAGYPCIFVRLGGCNLACKWCDTAYARSGGGERTIREIIREIKKYPSRLVMVTGGEPLHQKGTLTLIKGLSNAKYRVLLETNGSYTLKNLPSAVIKLVDVKCPGSGESGSFIESNIRYMTKSDELNFVICDLNDFSWALKFINDKVKKRDIQITFTPAYGVLKPSDLAEWILKKGGLNIRLSLQLHKFIWGKKKGR